MEKKVSVIIPFYNGVEWLCEAVQSVLDQTYKNFEIIVVNDGSTENLDAFINKYGTKIIYKFQENKGPAAARNFAMSFATGEYVAFLDSDDIWLPTKTEKQISFMEERGIIWSHTGYYNWYPELNKTILKTNSNDYGDVYLQSFLSLKAPTPAIIINKTCFDEYPQLSFFEDMRFAEDSALWSKIAFYYPLGLLDDPLVKIRQRGTNADRSSLIRFQAKTALYNKILDGEYKNINNRILLIYNLYKKGNSVLNYLKEKMDFSKGLLELTGKVFWITPFLLERIEVYKLKSGKNKNYYKTER
jgi:glycosyltransferase involved in cell wall biosynthesis